mgnify:CR=1 FL=1
MAVNSLIAERRRTGEPGDCENARGGSRCSVPLLLAACASPEQFPVAVDGRLDAPHHRGPEAGLFQFHHARDGRSAGGLHGVGERGGARPVVEQMQKAIWRVERIIKATLLFTKGLTINAREFNLAELKGECEAAIECYTYGKEIKFSLNFAKTPRIL